NSIDDRSQQPHWPAADVSSGSPPAYRGLPKAGPLSNPERPKRGRMSGLTGLWLLAIILILFGAGKLPRVMGDFAKRIKNFKAGMRDDD
ncbi:MAG: twin-arginine translocase TatA/TatE family subunit, partial [Geminicoccales bacterium]